jgi:hypothetical protein
MVKDRVEAVVNFSGVESAFCSDMDIKEKYFPDEEWLTAGLFCAPADIFVDLETVGSMISRDDEQATIYFETRDVYKEMIEGKSPDTLLYYYNERNCEWVRHTIRVLPGGKFWLVFDLFCRVICYATIAGAIRIGVAPW